MDGFKLWIELKYLLNIFRILLVYKLSKIVFNALGSFRNLEFISRIEMRLLIKENLFETHRL